MDLLKEYLNMSKSALELLEERAKLFNVDIPDELIRTIELGEEFKDYCSRLSDEMVEHVDCIEAIYNRDLESHDNLHTYWGETIPEAIKELYKIVQELKNMSHDN